MAGQGDALSGVVAEHYRIERLIGAGGMGAVYKATDTRLKRTVALKALLPGLTAEPTSLERFRREARMACRVSHPYVATVFDVVQHEEQLLIVMEYLEGRTLSEVLREWQPSQESLFRWILEIGEALAEIHRAGIVHRDVKPANVMITEAGHAKVTDFGLARQHMQATADAPTATAETELTESGTAIGTMLYMSPEQLCGMPADPRSDQFAFGVLIYEALTGVHPFGRDSMAESVSAILEAPPSGGETHPLWSSSADLRSVVARMLGKRPTERFVDSDRALRELRAAVQALQIPADPGPGRRRRLAAAALAGVIAVAAGVAGLRYWLLQPPTWERERYVLAIAPFGSAAGDEEARLEAALLTDLLTQDLQASRLIRAEGPQELQLASLSPLLTPADLGVKTASARSSDYVILGVLSRNGKRWRVQAEARASREGRRELPPIQAVGDGALELAEELAAAIRRRLPEVSRLTALRDDRVDLEELTSSSAEARREYERGVLALREGRLVEAIEALEKATALDGKFALAFARLADALDLAGYSRRARDAADKARDRLPVRPGGPAEERLALTVGASRARIFGRNEDWVKAVEVLALRFPDEPALLERYSQALRGVLQYSEALQVIDRAVQLDARNPSLRLSRAAVLTDLERYDDSARALEEAHAVFTLLGSREGLAAVETQRGENYQHREDYDQAFASYARAAEGYAAQDRPVSAAEVWLAARSAMLERGDVAGAEGRIADAERVARETGNHRLLCQALASKAVLQFYRRDYDGAIRHYREAIDEARLLENTRLKVAPLGDLASLLVWLRRTQEALPLLEEFEAAAAELGQRDALQAALINQGEVAHQLGDLDGATRAYGRLLDMAGEEPERMILLGHLGLGALHRERGRYGASLQHLDSAVSDARTLKRPLNLGRALLNRARLRSALGRDEEAALDAEEATSLTATYPDLLKALGRLRAQMDFDRGRWQSALERATADPDDETAAIRLVACGAATRLGRFVQARQRCGEILELERATPGDKAAALAWLGLAQVESGHPKSALANARAAVEKARELDLLLTHARASAALARLPDAERPGDWQDLVASGRAALTDLLDAAPESDRAALLARPDIAILRKTLG